MPAGPVSVQRAAAAWEACAKHEETNAQAARRIVKATEQGRMLRRSDERRGEALRFRRRKQDRGTLAAHSAPRRLGARRLRLCRGVEVEVKTGAEGLPPQERMVSWQLVEDRGRLWVHLQVKVAVEKKSRPAKTVVVDLGCVHTATDSDGEHYALPVREPLEAKQVRALPPGVATLAFAPARPARHVPEDGPHRHQRGTRHRGQKRTDGGQMKVVPAPYSSITCADCLQAHPSSRESQARFRCRYCGKAAHADHNAARVILWRAETPEPRRSRPSVPKHHGPDTFQVMAISPIAWRLISAMRAWPAHAPQRRRGTPVTDSLAATFGSPGNVSLRALKT